MELFASAGSSPRRMFLSIETFSQKKMFILIIQFFVQSCLTYLKCYMRTSEEHPVSFRIKPPYVEEALSLVKDDNLTRICSSKTASFKTSKLSFQKNILYVYYPFFNMVIKA